MSGQADAQGNARTLSTAIDRWAGIGPYYAMFPVEFAFTTVERFAPPGGRVLDPFAGRASSIYAAAATGRSGVGIEINPVGWLYGRVKLAPASREHVLHRLEALKPLATALDEVLICTLPPFFHLCYAPGVLRFLLAARSALRWQYDQIDATLMALILVYLHGKRPQALSNQMRQGKAMSPDYCVQWWRERGLQPPDLDPFDFLRPRIEWRYAKGEPKLAPAHVVLGDATSALASVETSVVCGRGSPFDLLFTSPPYYAVTNYRLDQWLRLWMLGGPSRPKRTGGPWEAKFESMAAYRHLLDEVFSRARNVLAPTAAVYVRTDARPFTLCTTLATLKTVFGEKRMTIIPRPLAGASQTRLFGDRSPKPGEVDLILTTA